MPYILNTIYLLVSVSLLPVWLYRTLTTGEPIEGLWRKLAGVPPILRDSKPVVWFHAVSVGEVLLLRPLLEQMGNEHPDLGIVVSTFTPGGMRAARKAYPNIPIFYAPLDLSWSVRRVFRLLRPRLVVLSELELWPNLLLEAKRREVPVAVVSSRINDRDFHFYKRIIWLLRPALTAIKWWGAQTERDAKRISHMLGQTGTAIEVTGSLKYDVALGNRCNPETEQLRRLLRFSGNEIVFVAGSTHPPEEEIVMNVFRILSVRHPALRLILVPRSPESFSNIARKLRGFGVPFTQLSHIDEPLDRSAPVTLVDSVGELPAVWGLADLAFVGGSLASNRGGQSMIEPAALGIPLSFGPNVWNFQETVDGLLKSDAAEQVHSQEELVSTMNKWLQNPEAAKEMGRRAFLFVQSRAGAAEKTYRILRVLLQQFEPPVDRTSCHVY